MMMYDEVKTEDLDTTLEDHAVDELRYMCMARPISPKAPLMPDKYNEDPRHLYLDVDKKDLYIPPTKERMTIKHD